MIRARTVPGGDDDGGRESPYDEILQAFEDAELFGRVQTKCPQGCEVEPDGVCPHGYASPLIGYGC